MLTQAALEKFQRDGCVGPIETLLQKHKTALMAELEPLLALATQPEQMWSAVDAGGECLQPIYTLYDCHLDNAAVMRLVKDRALHQLAEQLLGEPVAVWRSTFWIKPARARRTEWHQDTFKEEGFGWFPNVNAWIAIDDTDPDNGVRFVAGSQQQLIELTRFKQPGYLAQLQQSVQLPAPPCHKPNVVSFSLKCGECVLFDGRTLHGAHPNLTNKRRAGLAVRFIPARLQLPGFTGQLISI